MKIKERNEVWWDITTEYKISIDEKLQTIRINENTHSMSFLILKNGNWEDLDETTELGSIIIKEWENGFFN
jgi:hypothetical protein